MLDTDLQKLAHLDPDRPLDNLNIDIWAGVAAREQSRSLAKLIAASQAFVLVCALIGGVAAGVHRSVAGPPDDLGAFSPHSPWVASARLDGGPPR